MVRKRQSSSEIRPWLWLLVAGSVLVSGCSSQKDDEQSEVAETEKAVKVAIEETAGVAEETEEEKRIRNMNRSEIQNWMQQNLKPINDGEAAPAPIDDATLLPGAPTSVVIPDYRTLDSGIGGKPENREPAGDGATDTESDPEEDETANTTQPVVSENPFWLAADKVFNPDPGAYAGKQVPENILSQPVPEVPDFGLEDLPEPLSKRGEKATINKRKMPKFSNRNSYPQNDTYPLPNHTEVVRSRWDERYKQQARYPDPETAETPFQDQLPYIWHPYEQSILKGDVPLIGEDVFVRLTAGSLTVLETQRVPTPSGISGARPDNADFFGDGDSFFVQDNTFLRIDIFQGETEVFKPPLWRLTLQPVYNVNYFETTETGALQPDPRGDETVKVAPVIPAAAAFNPATFSRAIALAQQNAILEPAPTEYEEKVVTRTRQQLTLQEGFLEVRLAEYSSTYDFVSARGGLQLFNSDFRGLVFNDTNLGYRIFGTAENNLWNYNLAYFDLREKNTNSELNTLNDRDQDVFIANLFRQDFIWPGYAVNFSGIVNMDSGNRHYDGNGFLARPNPVGQLDDNADHEVRSYYLGFSGEGKFGRVNISHSFYQAFGTDEFNGYSNKEVEINAQQAHVEVSYDRDWIRYKATLFYASGDADPNDGQANGFDSVLDNPNLIGGPFSYWVRQGFNLGGTSARLKQRNSLIPNLRSSKFEGQSNFVNPGVMIVGLGTDIELTTETRLFFNANYIRLVETAGLKQTLFTDEINNELGYDISLGIIARPLLNDNVVITAGIGVFLPAKGYQDIYGQNAEKVPTYDGNDVVEYENLLYSGFVQLTLAW